MSSCLAIDIGASSGRHILGTYENGELTTKEIYRFENGIKEIDGYLSWDMEYLVKSVKEGIKKCAELGTLPDTVAIDTWGVDYVLLDGNKNEIWPAVSYRDGRTLNMPDEVDKILPYDELYAITGIQRQPYNTIYQLMADKKNGRLARAKHLLMVPEYLSYRLTGVIKSEYTISSTSALLNAEKRDWDRDLMAKLGINSEIFSEISHPASKVGEFSKEVQDEVGFNATVVFAPSHDTASAVSSCEQKKGGMYISSGTWSLIGMQNTVPVLSLEAKNANFTNEGGVHKTYRFLKNIMGMWLFQSIRGNTGKKYTYDQMMQMAMESDFTETFDPNDTRLLAPENMIEAIRDCLGKPELPLGDVLNSTYHSLAMSYKRAVQELEKITGDTITGIQIVGGGSKDVYLNNLTEKYTGCPVVTGPVEATAMGNLKTQFEYLGIKI